MLNVFNQKALRHRYNYLNRRRAAAGIDLHDTNLANGYNYDAMIAARPDGAGPFDPATVRTTCSAKGPQPTSW